jgi:uncharacterized protein (DUF885 family)
MFPVRHVSAIVTVLVMPVASGMLTGCVLNLRPPAPPSLADSVVARGRLNRALVDYFRSAVPYRPDLAMALGLTVDLLPPHGEAAARNATRLSMQLAPLLDELDAEALTPREYVALQSLQWEAETQAAAYAFADLDLSLLSPRNSPLRTIVDVIRRHALTSAEDIEHYLSLLDDAAWWISGIRGALEHQQARGTVPPADAVLAFSKWLKELRQLTDAGALLQPKDRLVAVDSFWTDSVRARERQVQGVRLVAAMDSLLSWLETSYTTTALARPGLWQYAGGKEYYRHLLRRSSGLEITPEEAHRVGLSELNRLDSLLAIIRRDAGWNPSAAALQDSLRRIPRLAVGSLEAVMARVRTSQPQFRDTMESAISALPSSSPVLRAATPLERWLYPDGYVIPPAVSDSIVTVVATQAWADPDALVEGTGLDFRWLWPGAALATAVGFTTDESLGFVLLHPNPATQDGWAAYAASLAGQLGSRDQPLDVYGRLLHDARNAALLVVDTGIHYFGWSKAQGLALLGGYSLAGDAALDAMLCDRVIATPGQAGAATLGRREFAAMRAWMEGELGTGFSAPAWHAELLSLGPAPLPVLGAHLEWWEWSVRDRRAKALEARTPGQ